LDILAENSGYASFLAVSGKNDRLFFRGARFILEQPEFEDIQRLKNLFYALEVKICQLQDLLFHCFNENVKILIGDEIGFEEISDCSLVVSGSQQKNLSFALALLGPMRMDYTKAASYLCSIKRQLREAIEQCL
jgi:heat-inducible transcriptional repressor